MDRRAVLTNPRLAGCVRRYHTWPMLNTQTVAEHTWQILRIWWQIFGPLAPEESTYVIWHDGGEIVSGDPPFPVKARNPDFKAACDRVENHALVDMLGHNPLGGVHPRTKLRAKICDLIEMLEMGLQELAMGNTFAQPIIEGTTQAIMVDFLPQASEDDRSHVRAYVATLPTRYVVGS